MTGAGSQFAEAEVPVLAGLPTPENSPRFGVAAAGGSSVFDFPSSSSTASSLWSAVLRRADDATAVSELARQFRHAVDAAAAAAATVAAAATGSHPGAGPTLRDLVCASAAAATTGPPLLIRPACRPDHAVAPPPPAATCRTGTDVISAREPVSSDQSATTMSDADR